MNRFRKVEAIALTLTPAVGMGKRAATANEMARSQYYKWAVGVKTLQVEPLQTQNLNC